MLMAEIPYVTQCHLQVRPGAARLDVVYFQPFGHAAPFDSADTAEFLIQVWFGDGIPPAFIDTCPLSLLGDRLAFLVRTKGLIVTSAAADTTELFYHAEILSSGTSRF